jgi:Protein of unknown function (DUF3631)
MPPSLRNRAADNWRILLSIADDLGHGEDARGAAIALCANRPDEDPGVILLNDIRVFDTMGVDDQQSGACGGIARDRGRALARLARSQ